MSHRQTRDIETIIRQGSAVDDAMVTTRRSVVERHRQTRIPLVIWRDGQVVEVAPETVALPAAAIHVVQEAR